MFSGFLFCSGLGEWTVKPWPNQFSMIQYQYLSFSDGSVAIQNSSAIYNYDILCYRCDNVYLKGTLPSSAPKNITSFWINNTLSAIIYPFDDDSGNNEGNCTSLDFGFSMPVPTWFINDSILIENGSLYSGNGLWLIHELDVDSNDITKSIKNTFHLKKDSPDGYFNYYAINDDKQTPFRLSAPNGGFIGKTWVVNDFYNFSSPGLALNTHLFELPDVCKNKNNKHHQNSKNKLKNLYKIRNYKDITDNEYIYKLVSSLGPMINYHIKQMLHVTNG